MLNIIRLIIFLIGILLSYSKTSAEQYDNHAKNYQQSSLFTIAVQTVSDAASATPHKPNADEKLMDWLSGMVDFRLTDFFLVIFTWILATKTSVLSTETTAMRAAVDEQRSDMLRSIKATEIAAAAAMKRRLR
jgi:hypothetical protein